MLFFPLERVTFWLFVLEQCYAGCCFSSDFLFKQL